MSTSRAAGDRRDMMIDRDPGLAPPDHRLGAASRQRQAPVRTELPGVSAGAAASRSDHCAASVAAAGAPGRRPAHPGILLNLDAHISATSGWPGNARSRWIAPDDDDLLLTSCRSYDRARNINLVAGILPGLTDSFTIDGVPTEFTAAATCASHPGPPRHHQRVNTARVRRA
ncbi:hypothetical protein ABZS66_33260 [Dactylosporangium sp. NPDC005572]|uniref:hypothetical protein n=1 Tax=Dactylosporangium sp. NPDC005572 TaxID=3156889 RepID=UPI0033BCCA8C